MAQPSSGIRHARSLAAILSPHKSCPGRRRRSPNQKGLGSIRSRTVYLAATVSFRDPAMRTSVGLGPDFSKAYPKALLCNAYMHGVCVIRKSMREACTLQQPAQHVQETDTSRTASARRALVQRTSAIAILGIRLASRSAELTTDFSARPKVRHIYPPALPTGTRQRLRKQPSAGRSLRSMSSVVLKSTLGLG